MKIGVAGYGVVGSAVAFGLSKLNHKIAVHDPKLKTDFSGLLDTEICYICVPTKANDDDSCDTSIVESVVAELCEKQYRGIIAIKSTVSPGTTKRLIDKHANFNICFVPEFLRERCAIADFTENQDICVIGTDVHYVFQIVKNSHGHFPKEVIHLSPGEAELCKYFVNIYNATLVTFANSFYEACAKIGVDYSKVKGACVKKSHIHDAYLDCNDNMRGFGGVCLPKDLKSIAHLMKDTNVEFFKNILAENAKYKVTVFDGMRPV